jgi:hypothetical protein
LAMCSRQTFYVIKTGVSLHPPPPAAAMKGSNHQG